MNPRLPQSSQPNTNFPTKSLPIIGLILAFLLPPAGLIISAIVLLKGKKQAASTSGPAVVGVLVGAVLTFFILWIGSFVLTGGLDNTAEKNAAPIMSKIERLGGTKFCDNGDAGGGGSNLEPWYSVSYEVNDSPELTDKLKDIVSQEGFVLENDTREMERRANENIFPNTVEDFLTGTNGDRSVDLYIYRRTQPGINCAMTQYEGVYTMKEGNAMVKLNYRMPSNTPYN